MKTVLESGVVLPEPIVPSQLRADTIMAFNLLVMDGRLDPETEFDFQYGPRGEIKVRLWVPDPQNRSESLAGVILTDPKELIAGVGNMKRIRGGE